MITPKLIVYQVLSTNLEVYSDGKFDEGIFLDKDDAIKKMKEYPISKEGSNITEDIDGSFTGFQGESLAYARPKGKPAVYYNSYYGNYKCAAYIQELYIY